MPQLPDEPVQLKFQPGIVELIKFLQSQQEEGNIRMLMAVIIDKDGFVICHHSDIVSTSRAIGSLEMLKHRLLAD